MPISYRVDHRRQRIRATAVGVLNVADIASYIASRVRDGVYDYDQLIDFSHAELLPAAAEVVNVVKQARVHLSERPIPFTALVAPPGSPTYGVARQLSAIFGFEGATVQIEETVDAADRWLNEVRAAAERGGEPAGGVN